MNEPKSYLTRREAVKVLALVTASALAGSSLHPDQAQAKTKYYKIIYKLNGGKNPSGQTKKLRKGKSKKVSKLKKPTRKGYTFKAWYTDKNLTKKAKRVYGKKKKVRRRLYAKWTLTNYKITYKLNSGSTPVPLPSSYNYTMAITLMNPVRNGYAFGGWYSDKKFKTRVTKIEKKSTGKLTLYAKWNAASYWTAHVMSKCSEINALRTELIERDGENSVDSFIFITDMHLPSNAMYSPTLIKQVVAQTGIQRVVFGGDAISLSPTATEASNILKYVRTSLDYDGQLMFLRGNHDGNDEGGKEAPLNSAAYCNAAGVELNGAAGNVACFYRDNAECKIRYIVLDTGNPSTYAMADAQTKWLSHTILDEKIRGWTVLIFQHQFFHPLRGDDTPSNNRLDPNGQRSIKVINALYEQAAEQGTTIAAVITGHGHYDHAEQPSIERSSYQKGYPYWAIATTCDACDLASSRDPAHTARKRGTTGEQAFDVVTIDTASKTLHYVRIGGGTSRGEFYYGPPETDTPEQ